MNDILRTIIINLFAGPGAGKSTMATSVFSLLKMHGVNCEYVSEYAKDLVWESKERLFSADPIYIFAKQYARLKKLIGKVEVVITDSPLLISSLYHTEKLFNNLVSNEFHKYENVNYFVERKKDYNPLGRTQTESEAVQKDMEMKNLLDENLIEYKIVPGNFVGTNMVALDILTDLGMYLNVKLTKV